MTYHKFWISGIELEELPAEIRQIVKLTQNGSASGFSAECTEILTTGTLMSWQLYIFKKKCRMTKRKKLYRFVRNDKKREADQRLILKPKTLKTKQLHTFLRDKERFCTKLEGFRLNMFGAIFP